MKKLITTALSTLTTAVFIAGGGTAAAAAEVTDALTSVSGTITPDTMSMGDIEGMTFTLGDTTRYLSNFSEDTHIHRNILDANNDAVYEAISELTDPSFDQIVIKLPEPVSFTASSLNDDTAFSNAVFANCKPGMDLCLFDMPEIFWLDESRVEVGLGEVSYSYSRTKKQYTITFDEILMIPGAFSGFSSLDSIYEYKGKLAEAIEDFSQVSGTRYDMLKQIHDHICDFTYYDDDSDYANSAVGAIVEPGAVCEGYAKSFKLICDYLDIPCIIAVGNFEDDGLNAHMWNYVRMDDGKWYGMDVTWDDYDGKYGYDILYSYFVKGSDNFFKDHEQSTYFNLTSVAYPELSASDYDPAWQAHSPATTTSSPVTTTSTTVKSTTTSAQTTTTTAKTTTTTAKTTTTTKIKTTTSTSRSTTTSTRTSSASKTTTTKASTSTTKKSTSTTTTKTMPVTTTTTTPEPVWAYGDLNHDGEVNVADLVCCAKAVHGSEKYDFSCDINEDGRLTVFDVLIMRELVAKQL